MTAGAGRDPGGYAVAGGDETVLQAVVRYEGQGVKVATKGERTSPEARRIEAAYDGVSIEGLGGRGGALSELEMRILAFERGWWRYPGAKEREILEVFGMPVTRYYQLLNALIDRPEASPFDPVLVARLRQAAQPQAPDPARRGPTD